MAQIKIKRGSGVPAGLTYGELAYDVTNKRLYIGITGGSALLANTDGGVSSFNGLTGAVTGVTTGTANTFQALQSFASGISASGGGTLSNGTYNFSNLKLNTVGGDEGGQLDFGPAVTNTSLTGGVSIDVYQNRVRIFESGGTNRGVYVDLSGVSAGVGTNLIGGGGGAVSSVSGSGNGISVSPTTGAVVVQNTGVHSFNGLTGTITGVSTVNGLTGGVTFAAGTGITLTASGNTVTITSTGSSTITTSDTNSSSTFYPVFVGSTGSTAAFIDKSTTPFYYVPSSGQLTTGSLTTVSGPSITDYTQTSITENAFNGFSIISGGGIGIDSQSASTTIGDVNGLNNATTLTVNDATLTVETSGSLYVSGSANILTGLGVTGNSRINGNLTVTSGLCAAGVTGASYILSSGGIKTLTGTTYTFLAADNGRVLTMNNGSAITATVPSGLPVGYSVTVIQLGAGQVSFSASGTTINSYQSYTKIAGQHGSASLVSYSSNVFNLAGSLSA